MKSLVCARVTLIILAQIFFLGHTQAQEKAQRVKHTGLYEEGDWFSQVKKVAPLAVVDGCTPVLIVHQQSSVSVSDTETLFITPLFDAPPDPFKDVPIAGYQILIFNHKHQKSPWKTIWKKGAELRKIESLWEVSSDLTIRAEYGVMSIKRTELFKLGALHSSPEFYIMAKHRKADRISLGGGFMTGSVMLPDPGSPSDQFKKTVTELFALASKE